jgi:hypothetical protein
MPLPRHVHVNGHDKNRFFSLSPPLLALFSATVFVPLRLVAIQAPPCSIRIRRGSRFRRGWPGSLAGCAAQTKGIGQDQDKVVVVFVDRAGHANHTPVSLCAHRVQLFA